MDILHNLHKFSMKKYNLIQQDESLKESISWNSLSYQLTQK